MDNYLDTITDSDFELRQLVCDYADQGDFENAYKHLEQISNPFFQQDVARDIEHDRAHDLLNN